MKNYSTTIQIRWADIDANRHLRHSAYYDYGAAIRVKYLHEHGLSMEKMAELKIGPVLFREEAVFKREIKLEDSITVDIELLKAASDFSRWSIRHHFRKGDESIAAVLQVDGAWIDLEKRRLAQPHTFIQDIFNSFPKSLEFEELVLKK